MGGCRERKRGTKKGKAGGREERIGDWRRNEGRVGDPRVYL